MTITKTLRLVGRPVFGLIAVTVALVVMDRGPLAQSNPTSIENGRLTGVADASQWDVNGAGDLSIQGFATDISVNTGGTIGFKINTPSMNYHIDIYRLGYYANGAGGRKIATISPSATPLPQVQPACLNDSATGLYDCGNWAVSATWNTASTPDGLATSGIYVAKLIRDDLVGPASHIVFVVRDDARPADVIVQTSDTTWQAYNRYGIADVQATAGSLYCGGPISNAGSAYANACSSRSAKVSYNRPIDTRGHSPQSFFFNAEYPMVRWLEANGYNVKYISGVDTERRASDLVGSTKPKVFLSSGHDEYWSAGQRASVEAARAAAVNLAFFSGNEMYWKTRFEGTIDGTGTAYRTLVSYKDTLAGVKLDPMPNVSTGTWRDLRFGPPVADGGRPENGVIGNIWTVNSGTPAPAAITVPSSMASLRFWRSTSVAALATGATATLAPSSLGYEWDEDLDNGARPAGLIHLSSTTVNGVEKIIDFGGTTGIGTATHTMTLYRHSSGALVFGAGTVQWAWGLDGNHDDHSQSPVAHASDQTMQQATMNLLADMGAQPATVQTGLAASAGSSDTTAPTSTISAPAAGATVGSGSHVTISGTASDSGGTVAGVEVSTDGGVSWHAATGRTAWSYDWIPGPLGAATIKSRAVDDSGNIETAGSGIVVTVSAGSNNNLGLWPSSPTPALPDAGDAGSPVELGVKFRSDTNSLISGVRFYKSAANVGTHVGNLWTISGTLLASTTFVNESPSGWQTATFATPVTLTAGTTYVVSYHTNVGHYSADGGYFGSVGVDSAPFHAPASPAVGGNGVYVYGASALPTLTFNGNNYWVDVMVDRTAPTIADVHAVIGDVQAGTPSTASVLITWNTTEDSNSRIDYSTVNTFPSGQTNTVSDPAYVMSHSLTLTGLQLSTQYYFRLSSADRAGNVGTLSVCANATCPGAPGPVGTSPLGFLMPGPTMHDTRTADFSQGTSSSVYVSEAGDGEVILAPALGTEFSGTTLPAGWATSVWSSGGSAVVGGGRLVVSGARVATCVDTGTACTDSYNLVPGRSVEFVATFTGDLYQHAGLGQTLSVVGEPFALFSTVDANGANADGSLFVRTSNGAGTELANSLGPGFLGAPHRFRIDWIGNSVSYFIDGSAAFMFDPNRLDPTTNLPAPDFVVATHSLSVAGPMRVIAASEFRGLSGKVVVDWTHLSPYAASGTFTSRVFDAGVRTTWQSICRRADTALLPRNVMPACVPSDSSVAISVRMGNTPTPDGTWSAFGTFAAGGQSRYIQYQATMATGDPTQTPELDDITITGTAVPPVTRVTPTITWPAPAPISYGTPLGAAQLNATASVASANVAGTFTYTPPAGTVLGAGGQPLSVSFTPTDTTLYTSASAGVSITVTPAPASVTPNAASKTYGGADPALTGTLSGFRAADGVTATYSRTAGESAGSYTISSTLSPAGVLGNYAIAYNTASLTISQASSTTALSASSTSFRFGAPLTLTATVAVVAPGAGTPIGSVTFMDGSSALSGPVALNAGVATFSTALLPVGTHAVTAVYSGGTNFTGSTSSPSPIRWRRIPTCRRSRPSAERRCCAARSADRLPRPTATAKRAARRGGGRWRPTWPASRGTARPPPASCAAPWPSNRATATSSSSCRRRNAPRIISISSPRSRTPPRNSASRYSSKAIRRPAAIRACSISA